MILLRRAVLIVILLGALSFGFGGGILFSQTSVSSSLPLIQQLINQGSGKPDRVDFSLFWEVWNTLHKQYVDPDQIDDQELLYGAIKGMVDSVGDPYTVFLEPATSQKFQEEISGSFGGVGIEVGKRDDLLTVIAPISGTPADRAGLKTNDRIVQIDKTSTVGMSVEEAVTLIRGRKGSRVVLTIAREGQNRTFDVELTREEIKVPTIKWRMLEGEIAYLQLLTFNSNAESDFRKAANEILNAQAKGLILDLRGNPGGLLDAAVNIAGWFLDRGSIVTIEKFRDGTQNELPTSGNGALKAIKTVVLINGGSASASEILAGALHDNRSIELIGEKSFGKGSVQQLEEFRGGSSLKVTIAKWLTPHGLSITDEGINPTIEVEISDEDRENSNFELGTTGKDPQLDKAIEKIKDIK